MARTEGHRLLDASGLTPAQVVKGTGRTHPTVRRWFRDGKPDVESCFLLRDFAGIPVEAWTQKPNGKRKAS